jgi:hypothetical protein
MNLPHHQIGLFLSHNAHKVMGQTIEEYVDGYNCHWHNDRAKKQSIESDELWLMEWCKSAPQNFRTAAAPSLDELLHLAETL